MSAIRMLDVQKTNRNGSLRLALACASLVALAAAPLHAQQYQDLYDFNCDSGCTPYGRLTQGTDGNPYGTTFPYYGPGPGGSNNLGTIFMLSTAGVYTVLFNFDSTTGAGTGGLTLASDGNFYGTGVFVTTATGTLFQFNPLTDAVTVLHNFSATEGVPAGPPVEAKDGNLYGVAGIPGESGKGIAYSLTLSTQTYALLPKTLGGNPSGPLFAASDGYLYGATGNGGHREFGTLFRLSTATGAIKKLYTFTHQDDGATPNAPLTQGKNGNLYGTAYTGGLYGYGTIYEVTLPSDGFGAVYSFNAAGGAGIMPAAGLLAASDENFYGTTYDGGADGLGQLFAWETDGSYLAYVDFTGNGGVTSGANPDTALMEDTDGMFYGLTPGGGASGGGVFYTFTPPNPLSHINLCCNWFVVLDQPVTIIGQNLSQVYSVSFGSVNVQFEPGSGTSLITFVPSAAIDSPVTVTLDSGLQLETQQSAHILPAITSLDPSIGQVGTPVSISGGGFAGTTEVTFGGVAAANFTVVSPSLIQATVPVAAVTGKVGVVTPNGSAKSPKRFTVN